ncbi:hypothetical protein GGR56DRAFT_670070 [Xylariaceae sp. FL0804]|nr:hypothetical protein GGR56DRAFT_670070 [Xylariaceae sp. FL0804]
MPDQLYDSSNLLVAVTAAFITLCMVFIFWMTSCGLIIPACWNGMGMHDGRYTEREGIEAMKYFYLFQDLYVWGSVLIKFSLCCSLTKIGGEKRWVRWTLWVIAVLVFVTSTLSNVFIITSCTPVAALWDKTMVPRRCRDWRGTITIAVIYSLVNIVSDFVLALLPVFFLWRIQLPWRQKLPIMGVLSLGIFASCATLIRIHTFKFGEENDYLFRMAQLILWTVVEISLALIAGSMIAFQPIWKWFFGKRTTTSHEPICSSLSTFGQKSTGGPTGRFNRTTSQETITIGLATVDRNHTSKWPRRGAEGQNKLKPSPSAQSEDSDSQTEMWPTGQTRTWTGST